jgi:hypothetical protein
MEESYEELVNPRTSTTFVLYFKLPIDAKSEWLQLGTTLSDETSVFTYARGFSS